MAMNNLKNIIKKAKTDGDINTIIKDLEIYLVQKNCIIFLEEYENYIRILPKDSMCYVDILEDTFNNIDERNYIVFETLFNKDLLKYIEKMWIHKGSIRLILRENIH